MLKKSVCRALPALLTAAVLLSPPLARAPGSAGEAPTGETPDGPGAKHNMSYIYSGSAGDYAALVERTQGALDLVSPGYFDLNPDGSLLTTPSADQAFVDRMHELGIKVTPFLSNHWDDAAGRAALENRAALAGEISAAVYAMGLDGVNVDIENLRAAQRGDYTDFVRLLREAMPDKLITVAAASVPGETPGAWAASYDYEALAAYSDYLMLMTYDEHYREADKWKGTPGPVAGLPFVERSLQYALKRVPPEKIVLGIAFYGRIWKDAGGQPQGNGLSNAKVAELIARYGGTVAWDEGSQSPCAKITVRAADPKSVVGGAALEAGDYTIWFENGASIKRKLELANEYGILGTGSWSLGQELAETWDYYDLWLSGCYFGDIETHWAKQSVFFAWQKGWVKGASETTFLPDGPLTRAQAAVLLARALGLEGSGAPFDDTAGHWARAEMGAAREAGLLGGVGGNRFDPDAPMTREQTAVLLYRLVRPEAGAAGAAPFPDVSAAGNPWSYEAIEAMGASGILLGAPDGGFHPSEPLSRAQMAVLMERLSEEFGVF